MTLSKDDISHHISGQFNEDLQKLQLDVVRMGREVAAQIADAITALKDNDTELAARVVSRDLHVNMQEKTIDEECSRILVRRQPAAGDLRLIFAAIKTVTDLERAGDLAERIALTVLDSAGSNRDQLRSPIIHLGSLVLGLLNKALDAYGAMDAKMAFEIEQEDVAVDQEYQAVVRQLVTYMLEDPRAISWALNLTWAARAMERIGDHAKNIAEYVIYMVHGMDLRHTSLDERARSLDELEGHSRP